MAVTAGLLGDAGNDQFNLSAGVPSIGGGTGTDTVNTVATFNFAGDMSIDAEVFTDVGGAVLGANSLTITGATTVGANGNIFGVNTPTLDISGGGTALAVNVANTADITIQNNGDILLGLVSSPGNTVNITAGPGAGADILNNNNNATNVEANTVNLTATDRIGVSETDSITLDINPLGAITLTFGATQAFINNINLTPVTVFGGGVVVDFNTLGGAARDFSGKAQDTELTDVGFVDWSLFSEDLSLFGVVEPGIKLPKDQIEDDLVLKTPEPDVPVLMKTARGWEFMWTYSRTAFDGLVRPEAQRRPVSF